MLQAKLAVQDAKLSLQPIQNHAKRQRDDDIASLCNTQTTLLQVQGAKPLDALDLLERNLPNDPPPETAR